jgi:hypothetical protein
VESDYALRHHCVRRLGTRRLTAQGSAWN